MCWKLLFVLALFVTVFYFSWIYVGLFSEVLDYHICKPCKVFLGKKKFDLIWKKSCLLKSSIWIKSQLLTGASIGLLMENVDICAPTLTKILHSCIADGILPSELKLADITPILKYVDSTTKKKYRPRSILDSVSKLFENRIQRQINTFLIINLVSSYMVIEKAIQLNMLT